MQSKVYYLDTKSDRDNYQYGYLYRLEISAYIRIPFCIGVPNPFKYFI